MRLLTRSRRGNWLAPAILWLAACGGLWWYLPVRPYRVIHVDPPFWTFDFTPDGAAIATFSGDFQYGAPLPSPTFTAKLQYWDCATGELIRRSLEWDAIMPPSIDWNNRRWWSLGPAASGDMQPRLLDIARVKIDQPDVRPDVAYAAGATSQDNRFVVFWTKESTAIVWDRRDQRVSQRFTNVTITGHPAISADARRLAFASQMPEGYPTIRVIERETSREIACIRGERNELIYPKLNPAGSIVFAAVRYGPGVGATYELRAWDANSGQPFYTIPWTCDFALHPDGKTIIVACSPPGEVNRLEWREVASGKLIRSVPVTGNLIESKFLLDPISADGAYIVMLRKPTEPGLFESLADRLKLKWPFARFVDHAETCIFNARTGEELGALPDQKINNTWATYARWSPDGKTLAGPLGYEPPYSAIGFWDVPPKKPLSWFFGGAIALALPIAFLTHRRVRRMS